MVRPHAEAIVVSDGDADKRRLDGANDIPARARPGARCSGATDCRPRDAGRWPRRACPSRTSRRSRPSCSSPAREWRCGSPASSAALPTTPRYRSRIGRSNRPAATATRGHALVDRRQRRDRSARSGRRRGRARAACWLPRRRAAPPIARASVRSTRRRSVAERRTTVSRSTDPA